MPHPTKKTLIHFSGFEPQSAEEQKTRLIRSVSMSAKVWGFQSDISDEDGGAFTLKANGTHWTTETTAEAISIGAFVNAYALRPFLQRLISGYGAFFTLFTSGAWFSYARHAWRFSLFALFPFLFFSLGVAAAVIIGVLPLFVGALPALTLPLSVIIAVVAFRYLFMPYADRLYTLMQFDDWRFAKKMAAFDDPEITDWVSEQANKLAQNLRATTGDITITSHSMGGVVAAHVVGTMLEQTPEIFEGRNVYFVQLGGAVMQSAWIKPAETLKHRVGLIAKHENITWLEVQCLTDPVNFYKCDPIKLCGFDEMAPVTILKVRFKNMLRKDHLKRIKFDIMRMHRQFIIGPDKQSPYDFGALAFGPLSPDAYIKASQEETLAKALNAHSH